MRKHYVQHWFNLANTACEEALYKSASLRHFVGIDPGCELVPDSTTITKSRVRSRVEHDFGVAKRLREFGKVRYRGWQNMVHVGKMNPDSAKLSCYMTCSSFAATYSLHPLVICVAGYVNGVLVLQPELPRTDLQPATKRTAERAGFCVAKKQCDFDQGIVRLR